MKAGIVTCGGLCPGLNDVIRHVSFNSYSCMGVCILVSVLALAVCKSHISDIFTGHKLILFMFYTAWLFWMFISPLLHEYGSKRIII